MRNLFRTILPAAALVASLAFAAPAFADNPHFIKASAAINNDGSLEVSWKEAGLGDNQLISYLASADGDAVYVCINGGNKHPQAANKEEATGPVSAEGDFASGKNGQITASLTVDPPASTLECPPGQRFELACVKYTNISLTDTTNGVTASLPGTLSTTLLTNPAIEECAGF